MRAATAAAARKHPGGDHMQTRLAICATLLATSTALLPHAAVRPRCASPIQPSIKMLRTRTSCASAAGAQPIVDEISEALNAVRALRPAAPSPEVQFSLWKAAGLNPMYKVSGGMTGEPSFTRLFDHETWRRYTGKSPIRRWLRAAATWRFSTVLAALWPIIVAAVAWAYLVGSLPAAWLPRTSPGPHGLMGSAIGLLLVFRTNNTYQRLGEARLLWGRAVFLCREIAQTAATVLLFDGAVPQPAEARSAASKIIRYTAAWCWELNAKLTGPSAIRSSEGGAYSDNVLPLLLPEKEAGMAQALKLPWHRLPPPLMLTRRTAPPHWRRQRGSRNSVHGLLCCSAP